MNDFVLVLKALADESRFRIINLLLTHDLCVGALAGHLNISKAAVSQHLQILRRAGLVRGEKRGYWTHYGVEKSAILQIAEELTKRANQAPDFRMACHRSVLNEINTNDMARRELNMCKDCCEHPDKLKGKPSECSEEQIKASHGDTKEHPCTNQNPAPKHQ
jgi:DNA-binding transcriptional ArsR family regulator